MNPTDLSHFLLKHGYTVLFVGVLAEQVGLPFPSGTLLLAAGALVGIQRLSALAVFAIAILASLLSDSVWYSLGKRRGSAILGQICRISLEPDSCVSQMHSVYSRYGAKSLLFCKFVPGIGTLGPAMAGMSDLALWKFLLLDAAGALGWSGVYVAIGWIFRSQLEALAAGIARFGTWFGASLAMGLAVYVAVKYIQRQMVYRSLRIARITAIELRQRIDARENLIILDLRDPSEWGDGRIPGSLQVEPDKLSSMVSMIARAEVILYCSCPREAQSARAALQLKRRGVKRVRPLEGGFARWHKLGFPVEQAAAQQGGRT
jgi:membrane protein DedA with SNARE-associated domain/rhodanese-related sulfurtransferase